jgi:hypothetical protein
MIFVYFDHKKATVTQNKYYILNQRKKSISNTLYLSEIFFPTNSDSYPPPGRNSENECWRGYGSEFVGKNISLRYRVFDMLFCADSEYNIYFVLRVSTLGHSNFTVDISTDQ